MKSYFAGLAAVCALMSGCVASLPNTNVTGYDVPQGFQYPAVQDPFVNEAIAQHKAYAEQDSTHLFTAPAPAAVDTCGVSPDLVRPLFLGSEEDLKKMQADLKKAAKRMAGMGASYKFMNEDPEFQILESICPAPGLPGKLTVRYKSSMESSMGDTTTKASAVSVAFLGLDQDRRPTNMLELSKGEAEETGLGGYSGQFPVSVSFSTADRSKSVSFLRVIDSDHLILKEMTPDKKRSKMTSWVDGTLAGITNYKGFSLHGETINFARKAKIFGDVVNIPETRLCYRNGLEVKTTGPCVVD